MTNGVSPNQLESLKNSLREVLDKDNQEQEQEPAELNESSSSQLDSLQASLEEVLSERKSFTGKDETLIKKFNEKLSSPIRSERDVKNFSYKDDGDFLVLHDSRAPNSPTKFRYNELVKDVDVSAKENINKMLDSLGFAKRRT